MIITVKNLQQQTFMVEFEPEKTVLHLKEKIFKERGSEYVVEKQKLIYAGVILDDERTIASYNVDEKKFVVVMLKREIGGMTHKPDEGGASTSRSDNSAASLSSVSSDTITTEIETKEYTNLDETVTFVDKGKSGGGGSDEDTKSVGSGGSDSSGGGAVLGPVGSNTSILSSGSGSSLLSGSSIGSGGSETSHSTYSSGDLAGVFSNTSLQSRAESNLLMGEEYNRTVESMIEMGYSREMVERAMAASFNNPERAVEYLISGIPETEDGFNATSATAGESILLRGVGVGANDNDGINAGVLGDSTHAVSASHGGTCDGPSVQSDSGDGLAIQSGSGGRPAIQSGSGDRPAIQSISGNEPAVQSCGDGPAIQSVCDGAAGENLAQRDGGSGDGTLGIAEVASTSSGDVRPREDPFEFLRNQPQFVQMRSLVYQNPDLLHAVLQQIGQTNPALLQLISENQDAFLSMLNQPMDQAGTPQYPRRMTPGRRAQLAAAARAAASGDGLHVRSLDTAPGAGGDGPPARQRPGESGDAGADTIPYEMLPPRPDRAAERRAAATDAFMRERAAAAAAVAALTAAASAAVERDSGGGEGGGIATIQTNDNVSDSGNDDNNDGHADGSIVDVTTIRLTPQDQDAIERLKALGFPETLVMQAYFACDKDEQLAANFLIASTSDD